MRLIETENLESFCRVLAAMTKYQINIPAYLSSQGQLRLVEAGKGLRVYHFFSRTGERVKIAISEDGCFSVHPLNK